MNITDWKEQAGTFLREVQTELKKVTWPSRRDAWVMTLVVITAVLISSLYLGVVDIALGKLVKLVL